MLKLLISIGLLSFGISTHSDAAVTITASEINGDVVMEFSGTLDFTGATQSSDASSNGFNGFWAEEQLFARRAESGATMNLYQIVSAPTFGTSDTTGPIFASSATGSVLEAGNVEIKVADGYAGEQLDGTLTFAGQTLESMGLLSNSTYTWVLANDSVVLQTSSAPPAVPEPSVALLVGCAGLSLLLLRRK